MKTRAVLPPIQAGASFRRRSPEPFDTKFEPKSRKQLDKEAREVQVKSLPPINYYYVSGRFKTGEVWNSDLNADYEAWLRHRKHLAEVRQQVDNHQSAETHAQYKKFRKRVKRVQTQFRNSEIDRENNEIYNRVKNAKIGISVKIDPFTDYVEKSIKKRYEYGRYLFQKKIARENTVLETRISKARPWKTAEEYAESYAKLKQMGEHYRRYEDLDKLKQLMRKKKLDGHSSVRSSQILPQLENQRQQEEDSNKATDNNDDTTTRKGQMNKEPEHDTKAISPATAEGGAGGRPKKERQPAKPKSKASKPSSTKSRHRESGDVVEEYHQSRQSRQPADAKQTTLVSSGPSRARSRPEEDDNAETVVPAVSRDDASSRQPIVPVVQEEEQENNDSKSSRNEDQRD